MSVRNLKPFGNPEGDCGTLDLDYLIGHFETLIHNEEDYREKDASYKGPCARRLDKAHDALQLLYDIDQA